MAAVCRFRFADGTSRETVEAQLALAIVAAECAFGPAQVRMGGGYSLSSAAKDGSSMEEIRVAIDVSTDVGEHIAQVFTGLMLRQLDEDEFTVERVDAQGRQ